MTIGDYKKRRGRTFTLGIILLMSLAVSSVGYAQELVSLDFKNTDIRDVARAVSLQTDANIVVDPDVLGAVTFRLVDVPLKEGLQLLVTAYGWELEVDGNIYRIKTAVETDLEVALEGDLLNIRFDGVSLLDACTELLDVTNTNMVMLTQPDEEVYLRLHNVELGFALDQLLKPYQYQWWQEDNVVYINRADDKTVAKDVELMAVTRDSDALQIFLLPNGKVTIKAEEISVRKVLAELALHGGLSFVLNDDIDANVNLVLYSLDILQALDCVVQAANLNKMYIDGLWWISNTPAKIALREEPVVSRNELHAGIKDLTVIEDRVSGLFVDVPLGELLNSFSQTTSETKMPSIVADGTLASVPISGAVSDLPIIEALRHLLVVYDLSLTKLADGYRVERNYVSPHSITYENGLLSVVAQDSSLISLLQDIGQITGVNFIIPNTLSHQVTIKLYNLAPELVVNALIEPYAYQIVRYDTLGIEGEWEGLYEIVPVKDEPVKVVSEHNQYTLIASNASLTAVAREISRVSGKNLLLQPGNFSSLSIELRELSLLELLETIMKLYDGTVIDQGSHYYLEVLPKADRLSSPVSYLKGITKLDLSAKHIELEFQDALLGNLLNEIYVAGGPLFIAEDNITNRLVSGEVVGTNPTQSLREYLLHKDYTLVPLSNKTLVRSQNSDSLVLISEGLFYLDISGGDLATILREMANKAGMPLVTYAMVRGSVSNIQVYGVTFEQALDYLLLGTTYSYRIEDGIYLVGEGITPRSDSPGFTESKVIKLSYITPSNIISLLPPSIPSQNVRVVPGQSAVVAFGNHDLIHSIEEFIKIVDNPSNVEPELLYIHYANSDEVVNIIARYFTQDMYQYIQSQQAILLTSSKENNDRIKTMVTAIDQPELQVKQEVVPINYISADDAKTYIAGLSTAKVLVLNEQNALMVSGRTDQIQEIKGYIEAIDKRNPQIVFDVMIVEVSDQISSQLGFNGGLGNDGFSMDLRTNAPFTLSLGSALIGDPQLTLTLSALVQEGKAKLLANPHLTTLSGKEAAFNVLTTNRYWTPQTETKDGDGEKTITTVIPSFRTIETGIRVRLKPWVLASGEITIELQPEISDSAGASSGSGLPSTNDRSVQTTVRVKDGETIVIGGLIQRKETEDISKVPVLGDLPVIGRMFRSESKTEMETEFIIAITCHLTDFE